MTNNIICPNCGTNNKGDSNFCWSCGKQLFQKDVVFNGQNNIQQNVSTINNPSNNDSEGNKLGIISLVLYFAGSALISFILHFLPNSVRNSFSALTGLCPLAGIVFMIVGRVKYPTNKFLKVVMWIIIASILLSIIAIILFTIWCYVTCSNLDTSGCD